MSKFEKMSPSDINLLSDDDKILYDSWITSKNLQMFSDSVRKQKPINRSVYVVVIETLVFIIRKMKLKVQKSPAYPWRRAKNLLNPTMAMSQLDHRLIFMHRVIVKVS